jgi:hypothetical protein
MDKLQEAFGKVDQGKLQAYEQTRVAAENERHVLAVIEQIPIDDHAPHVTAGTYNQGTVTHLSGTDKRQLLLQYGTTLAILAEAGTKAADALGVK